MSAAARRTFGRDATTAPSIRPQRTRRVAVVLVTLAVAAAALTACGGSSGGAKKTAAGQNVQIGNWGGVINPGGTPQRGGTLRVDMPSDPVSPSSLYYLAHPDNGTGQIALQIFDQLVEYLPGSLDPQPGLAEHWTISGDGLTYTFTLRQAQFSNGTPVTSADVKYVLNAARGGVDLDGTGAKSFFADQYGVISGIDTPDDKTVVLHLKKPSPALMYFLAYVAVSIVPAKVVQQEGIKAFNSHPIGSGPFLFESYTRDQEVTLTRNPNYWRKGQPYLDKVRFAVTPDDNTRVLNIQSGSVDVADRIAFSQVATIDKGSTAKVLVVPGGDMNVLWINNSKKPFNEVAVRQALNYATPVDSIVKVVFSGLAPRMNTITPKMKYWPKDLKPYPYDPQKAKDLLAKSSVPNGFSATLNIPGSDQAAKQEAQIIQQAWKQIGVQIAIKPLDDAAHSDDWAGGKYQLTLFPPGPFTTDIPVEDEFAALLFDSPALNNFYTWYKNPAVTSLVQQALTTTDEAKRAALFQQMHVKSMEDPPVVPLTYTPGRAAVSTKVHAFNYLTGGLFRLETVWMG
jgi:peptide/nickel transport system substrate-binding protein